MVAGFCSRIPQVHGLPKKQCVKSVKSVKRSLLTRPPPEGMAFFRVVKTTPSRGRTERTLFLGGDAAWLTPKHGLRGKHAMGDLAAQEEVRNKDVEAGVVN